MSDAEEDAGNLYADDRQLVQIASVWSLSDALKLQTLLDQADVPFFMGDERATRAEGVTSNFRDGVSVQVMQIDEPGRRKHCSVTNLQMSR